MRAQIRSKIFRIGIVILLILYYIQFDFIEARKTYLVKETRRHRHTINKISHKNFQMNATLNDMRRRNNGQPTSPLTRPRVSEIYNYTITDTWPYYNTSEVYNVTERDPENTTYEYIKPYTPTPYIYYSRPSYTTAWCSHGPDDVQHN
jgi:hypothetical protein